MKRIGKLLCVITIMLSALLSVGCNKEEEVVANTVATKLVASFNEIIEDEKDLKEIASKISKHDSLKITVDVVEAEEGFLDGFDDEIKGFKKAYAIKPIIGTQPFVAYVFESDNAKELETTLKEKANKRWNICVEAEELETSVKDNYVFLVMSPKSFEE